MSLTLVVEGVIRRVGKPRLVEFGNSIWTETDLEIDKTNNPMYPDPFIVTVGDKYMGMLESYDPNRAVVAEPDLQKGVGRKVRVQCTAKSRVSVSNDGTERVFYNVNGRLIETAKGDTWVQNPNPASKWDESLRKGTGQLLPVPAPAPTATLEDDDDLPF